MTKRIARILLALLLSTSMLTACGSDDQPDTNDTSTSITETSPESETSSDTTDATESTTGNEEETTNNPVEGTDGNETDDKPAEDTDANETDDKPAEGEDGSVTSVASAEDAIAFINNNVYGQLADTTYIPKMIMTTERDLTNADAVSYNTGLSDLTGINSIIVSESGIGSFAYSFVYVRTDGTNTADIQKTLGEKINPNKWICVGAEKISSIQLDNDIVLVMGSSDQVNAVMDAVVNAADNVYASVGQVVAVMG